MERADPISIVERAYDVSTSPRDWLEHLAHAARPALDAGLGVLGWTYDLRAPGGTAVSEPVIVGSDPRFCHAVVATDRAMPAEHRELVYATAPLATTSSAIFGGVAPGYEPVAPFALDLGFADFLGVNAGSPDRTGVVVGAPLPAVMRLSPGRTRWWSRIAAHVAAAHRLRLASHAAVARIATDGRVLDATDGAAADREALRVAVRAAEHARGAMRRRDPERALELWRALIAGRYSLVDAYEAGTHRVVLVHENAPWLRDPRGLRGIEIGVAAYLVRGASNKTIGYALGLREDSVARVVARIARKLGCATRANAQALLASRPIDAIPVIEGIDAIELARAPIDLPSLSRREREVAREAIAGRATTAIAARLEVAERTVANHLASIYRKLGVGSRAELRALALGTGPAAKE